MKDENDEIRSAKTAVELNVDYLMGGTRVNIVSDIIKSTKIKNQLDSLNNVGVNIKPFAVATEFDNTVDLSGIILTRVDGDARGGAALSMRYVTGKPIKYIGVGEKITDLEIFYPDRLANRILGMGDVVTLVEKAQQDLSEEKIKETEEDLKKGIFKILKKVYFAKVL